MFRFESPQYLYLLIILPVIILLFWINCRVGRRRLLRLGKPSYVRKMMSDVSEKRRWIKFCLLIALAAIIILMLARPQMGMRMKSDAMSGIEVVVAIDVSNSMMAADVAPNRLDKAKQVVQAICNRLKRDKIALVVFAGNAFLQMPMSADNVSVSMFLDGINTGMVPTQGTSLQEALSVSCASFSDQKDVKRAVVVITDGEDHEGGVDDALSQLKKKDAKVYVLGIGEPKGAPIKVGNDYMRDASGQVVITRLNESMCRTIAKAASGMYIHIDNTNSAQDELVNELNHLQRTDLKGDAYEEYNDLFPWLAIVALILLVLEIIVMPRKSHYFDSWNLFKAHNNVGKSIVIVMMLANCAYAAAQRSTKMQTHKGNVAFNNKLDSMAVIRYKKAIAFDSTNYKAHYNLGNTYLRMGRAQEAVAEYERCLNHYPSTLIKAAAYHNIGVVNQASYQYDKAIDAYKNSLRAFPQDDRTRYNLALCQRLQKKDPKQNQSKNQQNKQQGQDDKQQQQSQNRNNQQNKQNNQPQSQQMSKQNAEQMLRAVQMKERDTQQKLKRKRVPITRRQLEKNW